MAAQETVSIALGKVLDQSGYVQDLREERSEEAEGRIENLMELVSAAREFETRHPEPTLGGFVDQLSLLSDADEEAGSQTARVLMMTMHSAKGLEFPVVVISGLEEGLFPHSRASEDEADLEEERRLCYVGITRAQRRLVLTSAARRRVFGDYQSTVPSRFIDEIPVELIEEVPSTFVTPQASFSNFRSGQYRTRRLVSGPRAGRAADLRLYERGSVATGRSEARPASAACAVRSRDDHRRRAAQRRHQAGRAFQLGRAEDPSREVREAGVCRRPVMIQRS